MLKDLNSATVLVPAMGTTQLFVFSTCGSFDPKLWIRGKFAGIGLFESLNEAKQVAEQEGYTIERHRDYFCLRPKV